MTTITGKEVERFLKSMNNLPLSDEQRKFLDKCASLIDKEIKKDPVIEALEKAGWENEKQTNVWKNGCDLIDEDKAKELFDAWDKVNGR